MLLVEIATDKGTIRVGDEAYQDPSVTNAPIYKPHLMGDIYWERSGDAATGFSFPVSGDIKIRNFKSNGTRPYSTYLNATISTVTVYQGESGTPIAQLEAIPMEGIGFTRPNLDELVLQLADPLERLERAYLKAQYSSEELDGQYKPRLLGHKLRVTPVITNETEDYRGTGRGNWDIADHSDWPTANNAGDWWTVAGAVNKVYEELIIKFGEDADLLHLKLLSGEINQASYNSQYNDLFTQLGQDQADADADGGAEWLDGERFYDGNVIIAQSSKGEFVVLSDNDASPLSKLTCQINDGACLDPCTRLYIDGKEKGLNLYSVQKFNAAGIFTLVASNDSTASTANGDIAVDAKGHLFNGSYKNTPVGIAAALLSDAGFTIDAISIFKTGLLLNYDCGLYVTGNSYYTTLIETLLSPHKVFLNMDDRGDVQFIPLELYRPGLTIETFDLGKDMPEGSFDGVSLERDEVLRIGYAHYDNVGGNSEDLSHQQRKDLATDYRYTSTPGTGEVTTILTTLVTKQAAQQEGLRLLALSDTKGMLYSADVTYRKGNAHTAGAIRFGQFYKITIDGENDLILQCTYIKYKLGHLLYRHLKGWTK